jgi:MSHA biogenesis protein MshK
MSLINDALKRASTDKPKTERAGAPATPQLTPVEENHSRSKSVLPLVLCIVGIGALVVAGGFWLKANGTAKDASSRLASTEAALKPAPLEKAAAPQEPVPSAPAKTEAAAPPSSAAPAAKETAATPSAKTETAAANTAAPHNPIERAAATLSNVQQRNSEGEAEADKTVSAPATQPRAAAATASSPSSISAPAKNEIIPSGKAPAGNHTAIHSEKPLFKLQAIYFRLKGPTVVINGKTLKVGDSIEGAKVLAIHRTSVDLEENGQKQTLTLR